MTIPTLHLSHLKYRPDIDGLRAIAVLSVVAFHAFPALIKGGFIGVDVFFVISGFLITTIIFENLDRGTFSFFDFYVRRIKRIFPALLLILIVSFIFGWFALLADEYKQLGKHIVGGVGFGSNFILWGEAGYFDNSAETKPLLHLWSLGIEEQFYILWPIILWFSWKKKFNLLTLTVTVFLISFALNLRGINYDSVATFYSPQTRFWELLSGSLLAWFSIYKKSSFARYKLMINNWLVRVLYRDAVEEDGITLSNVTSVLGSLLLIYGLWQITKDAVFPGKWAVIPVLSSILIILAGPKAWVNRVVLSNKVAVWFGLISFPLYLWHWPMLSFARIVEGETASLTIRIAAVVLSIVLAWLTYKLVERPIRLSKDGKSVSMLIVLMVVVGLVGYSSYVMDGYDFRSSIKSYVNNKNELVRTPSSDQSCLDYVELKAPLFPYCRYTNANSSETVAVVGDSHAQVAYTGIAELLKERGKNTVLLANSSCPPFLGSPTGNNQTEIEACNNRIDQLLQVLESKRDITTVFVFTRGPIYTTGTEPLTENKNAAAGRAIPLEQFVNSAQISFERLTSKGKAVFYVSENPELNFNPNSCLTRPFQSSTNDCVIKKESVYMRQFDYRRAFSRLKDVRFIDSLPAFCPIDRCLVFDEGGALLYADGDHLSTAGSRFQAKYLLSPYLN